MQKNIFQYQQSGEKEWEGPIKNITKIKDRKYWKKGRNDRGRVTNLNSYVGLLKSYQLETHPNH